MKPKVRLLTAELSDGVGFSVNASATSFAINTMQMAASSRWAIESNGIDFTQVSDDTPDLSTPTWRQRAQALGELNEDSALSDGSF